MNWTTTRAYLAELRSRLIKCATLLTLCFLVLFYYANSLFHFLAAPLLGYLPHGHLIAVGLTTPLTTPIRLSFLLSIMICLPYLCYQVWAFIAPGLYPKERDFILKCVFPSVGLFYAGLVFAYYVVLPLMFGFFARFVPDIVQLTPDMGHYLDFILTLFMAFGLTFQVPILVLILAQMGAVELAQLQQFRPYFVVIAFTIGMLLTPPDVLSQVLLALPMCLLYELGIGMVKVLITPPLASLERID